MNTLYALICCASISSGFSGTPTGAWLADWMHLEVRNVATAGGHLADKVDGFDTSNLALYVGLDASYWDSYDKDCKRGVEAVRKAYAKTAGFSKVIGTVPLRGTNWLYRAYAGAETSEQGCREAINEAIREGCKDDCVLIDADEFYKGHESEDIHLTPEIWKIAAEGIKDKKGVVP